MGCYDRKVEIRKLKLQLGGAFQYQASGARGIIVSTGEALCG